MAIRFNFCPSKIKVLQCHRAQSLLICVYNKGCGDVHRGIPSVIISIVREAAYETAITSKLAVPFFKLLNMLLLQFFSESERP